DGGIIDVIRAAQGPRLAQQHRYDPPLPHEKREHALIRIGPRYCLRTSVTYIRPKVDPAASRQVHLSRRGVRVNHRGDQELAPEGVDVPKTERLLFQLMHQHERPDNGQTGQTRLLRVGVNVRKQLRVESCEETKIVQRSVSKTPWILFFSGDLPMHLHNR